MNVLNTGADFVLCRVCQVKYEGAANDPKAPKCYYFNRETSEVLWSPPELAYYVRHDETIAEHNPELAAKLIKYDPTLRGQPF